MNIKREEIAPEFIIDDDGESKLVNFNEDGSIRLTPTGIFKCLKCHGEVHFSNKEDLELGFCTACERVSKFKVIVPFPHDSEIFVQNPLPIIQEIDFHLLFDIMEFVKDRLVFNNDEDYYIYCLGIISTWKEQWFNYTPYFQFIGAIESGKTRALEIIKLLSYRGLLSPAVTPTALLRLIRKHHCNLLLGQAEVKLNTTTEIGKTLQEIFLAGYRRGQYYIIADPNDPDNIIINDIYGFKALSSERLFSTALTSRSVIFNMKKAVPKKQIDDKESMEKIRKLRSQLLWYRFMVKKPTPAVNPLTGRSGEIFYPIITVARSLDLDIEEIVGFTKEKKKEFLEEMSGTETASILAYIQDREYGIEEVPRIMLKEIGQALDLRTQYVGIVLRNLGLKQLRAHDGRYVSLTDPKTVDDLEYLYKKFGVSPESTPAKKEKEGVSGGNERHRGRKRSKKNEISLNLIKASPYQPRLEFDLEDLRNSIKREGILVPIVIRKKDGYYELVDGERRVRIAREEGFKTIPYTLVDVDDATAKRMVCKVNTPRKDHRLNKLKEKAWFFKKLQDRSMSLQGIARECDSDTKTVRVYLSIFRLPKKYQDLVWNKKISIGVIREITPLLDGDENGSIPPQVIEVLDRAATEKHFGQKKTTEFLKPYLKERKQEQKTKREEKPII